MPRIQPIEVGKAPAAAKPLLEGVQKNLGAVPNMFRSLAHSPASLEAYLNFGAALGKGTLGPKVREQIALTVAGANSCEYCASAHTAIGQKLGATKDELARNLDAESGDQKTGAALRFARLVVLNRGFVGDGDVSALRKAGYTDGDIVEIIGTIAINLFTNYFNHIAQTQVDFPRVQVPAPVPA